MNPELMDEPHGRECGDLWRKSGLRARMEAIIAHERAEHEYGDHELALIAAPETTPPIGDRASEILKARGEGLAGAMIRASSREAQEFILQLVTPIGQPVGIAPDERAVARQVATQNAPCRLGQIPDGRGESLPLDPFRLPLQDFLAVLPCPRCESIIVLRDRLHDPGGGQLEVGGEPSRRYPWASGP